MKATSIIRGVIATAAVVLALPAMAHAATRYAAPGGTGPVGTCPRDNPCSASDALDAGQVNNGDLIRFFGGSGGSYTTTGFDISDQITVEPEPGTGTPTLSSAATTMVIHAPSTVRGLEFISTAPGPAHALHVNPTATSTIERVRVIAMNGADLGVQLAGTLRDSVVVLEGTSIGGAAIRPCCTGATLRNVTAIATAPSSSALTASTNYGAIFDVTLRNVIARGAQHGIRMEDEDGMDDTDAINLSVTSSNYSSASTDGSPDLTLSLGAGNQTTAPLFVSEASRDFRQKPGSPTIDAGTTDGLLGSLDFDGQPRIQGPAVDIGADEAVDPNALIGFGTVGQLKRKRSISIPITCPVVNCNVAVAANLVVKGVAKPAVASRVIKLPDQNASLLAGKETLLVFRLSKKGFKSLRAAKRARLTVAATAIDAVGFTGSKSASFRFKKAGKK